MARKKTRGPAKTRATAVVAARRTARSGAAKRPPRPGRGGPSLTVSLASLEVRHNGWPGEDRRETDLALILQIENPSGAAENRVVASERLPVRAAAKQVIKPGGLSPGANGSPFFGGPVAVTDHVNLHARLFIERTNTVGPILGAALNTVIGQLVGKIPLLPEPAREVLHIQIGKTIATELARATAIIPIDDTMAGRHAVLMALIAPRTVPGIYTPPGSPEPFKEVVVATEGELVALLHLELELRLPA